MFNKFDLRKYLTIKFLIIFILIAIAAFAILLFSVAILVSIAYPNKPNEQQQAPPSTIAYIDPANHYVISIPSNWTTTSDYGSQRTGISTTHEERIRTELTNLSSGNVGLNISVYEKAPTCDRAEKPNTTLAGLTARYNPQHYSWTINTSDSTIVIGYYYPGAGVYHRRMSAAPVSKSEMNANQQTINRIVSTLKLQASQPLQCP
jgi:hypothetical protein